MARNSFAASRSFGRASESFARIRIPAKPPTITKSSLASQGRWISWAGCVTEFLARSFHFEHEFERGLMLDDSLLVGQGEVFPDQTHVDPGGFGYLGRCSALGHGPPEKLAEREGFEPGRGIKRISKLLIRKTPWSPTIP
jgi:hypothetical protein